MARQIRLKYRDPRDGYYHITSRTVLKSFILDDVAKEQFINILKQLSQTYFIKVVTFTVMSNHFHLVVQMLPSEHISDAQLKERFHRYYNEKKTKDNWIDYQFINSAQLRRRFSDLSRFMQDLKQRFSRWYNRQTGNHGHVWSERFKSVMLETGRAVLACMVYVDLNSLRAGMVNRPEDYRFCGLAHYVTGGRAASWLDRETMRQTVNNEAIKHAEYQTSSSSEKDSEYTIVTSTKKASRYRNEVKAYLAIIYREGLMERPGKANLSKQVVEASQAAEFSDVGVMSLRRRVRHFTDGVFLGSKTFCSLRFQEFRQSFQTTKTRSGHSIMPRRAAVPGGLLDLHALRKLR